MLLSVLIRNYNEAANLEKTLLVLQQQKLEYDYEIVVSDNESTDNSVAVAESFGCRVIANKKTKLSYGQLLNFGIAHCNGEYIFLLSAHIAVIGETSLSKALAILINHPQAAYVCGTPANNINRLVHDLNPFVFSIDNFSSVAEWSNKNFLLMGAPCAIIRRSVWEKIKFDETLEFTEDRFWSRCVIESGYKGISGAGLYYYYFRANSFNSARNRQYAESLAAFRINGKPETHPHFYTRAIRTAFGNAYYALVAIPKTLSLLIRIRLIRSKKRVLPNIDLTGNRD